MPPARKNYEEQLLALWNAFAESTAESSDEEILAESREEGQDPHETAQRVRTVLRNAVKAYQQRNLRTAQEKYKRQMTEIYEKQHDLPLTPEARRTLLSYVFTRIPEMQSALLTAQHREFSSLTDADVESVLKQLAALGVLDELSGSGDKGQ